MSKFFDVPTRRVVMATMTLGTDLPANATKRVDMSNFDAWRSPVLGMKPMLLAIEARITGVFTTAAASAGLRDMFLQYLHDFVSLKGPGGIELIRDGAGWHRYLFNYLQKGELRGIRARALAANAGPGTASYTRTIEQFVDFVEHKAPDPYFRCWPFECFANKASGAELTVRLRDSATLFLSAAAVVLGLSSATIEYAVHLSDVPAANLQIPAIVLESNIGHENRVRATPGNGAYLRCVVANSPAPADNVGGEDDDLSGYDTIDSFGHEGRYLLKDESVDTFVQRVTDEVSDEPASNFDDPSNYRAAYRMTSPFENFDGHLRMLPLIYLRNGQGLGDVPVFQDEPKLRVNGDVRTALPEEISWLTQQVIPRTKEQEKAILRSIRINGTDTPISKAGVTPKRYAGHDPSRVPLIVDARS
ncbi:MAG TPA: hypothetical protein VF814_04600 [Casimicrobiaceae bacterium]